MRDKLLLEWLSKIVYILCSIFETILYILFVDEDHNSFIVVMLYAIEYLYNNTQCAWVRTLYKFAIIDLRPSYWAGRMLPIWGTQRTYFWEATGHFRLFSAIFIHFQPFFHLNITMSKTNQTFDVKD